MRGAGCWKPSDSASCGMESLHSATRRLDPHYGRPQQRFACESHTPHSLVETKALTMDMCRPQDSNVYRPGTLKCSGALAIQLMSMAWTLLLEDGNKCDQAVSNNDNSTRIAVGKISDEPFKKIEKRHTAYSLQPQRGERGLKPCENTKTRRTAYRIREFPKIRSPNIHA